MKAMILAAGQGKRMQPLTLHTPKPLLPVGGKALIVYHLERLQAAGCCDVVINLSYLGEHIAKVLGSGEAYGLRIHYSRETEALETAGGIIQALALLGKAPFWVINGDVWCDRPLTPLCLDADCLAHLLLVPNPPHHPHGDFVLDETKPLAGCPGTFLLHDLHDGKPSHEKSSAPAYTFSGLSVLRPELFNNYPPGPLALAPVLRQAMAQGRVAGSVYQGVWRDVGTPERLAELDQSLALG
jgi:MurNAc alpha-1-phosphate uridylyltransferase